MLHIIIYSPFPAYSGGRENWLFNISKAANKSGKKVNIYSFITPGKNFYDLSELENITVIRVPTLRLIGKLFLVFNKLSFNLLYVFDSLFVFDFVIKRYLKKLLHDGDVVLAMNSITELKPMVSLKDKGMDCKLLCSIRGQVVRELSEKTPWLKKFYEKKEKELLSKCDAILVNGEDTQAYVNSIGFESIIVPNGVDIDRFENPVTKGEDVEDVIKMKNDGYKIILMVGSLRPIKGTDDLILGAAELKTIYNKPFKIVLVGKGPQYQFQPLVSQNHLEDIVVFAGQRKNIPGLLHYADIAVCLSQGSGMSMAALESMAAGKMIVAWDTPVYHQLIENGKSGVLVPFKDHKALAAALRDMLDSPKENAILGKMASREVQKYSWDTVYSKLMEGIGEY